MSSRATRSTAIWKILDEWTAFDKQKKKKYFGCWKNSFMIQACILNAQWCFDCLYLRYPNFLLSDHIPDTITHSHTYVIFTPRTLQISLKPLLFSPNTSLVFWKLRCSLKNVKRLRAKCAGVSPCPTAAVKTDITNTRSRNRRLARETIRWFRSLRTTFKAIKICQCGRKSHWMIYSFCLNCAEVFA